VNLPALNFFVNVTVVPGTCILTNFELFDGYLIIMIISSILVTKHGSELGLLSVYFKTNIVSILGGVMVSVLVTEPKVRGFKPCRSNAF
jgi:hypothetical protein